MMNPPNDLLTPRERARLAIELDVSIPEAEITARLVRGDEIKEIARDLAGCESTVLEHKKRIYGVLGVHRLSQLVRIVLRKSPWLDDVLERSPRSDIVCPHK